MNTESYVIRIGGEAGWGLASAADIIAKLFINLGYNIFSSKDYASQIKGGHNYHTIRISNKEASADVKNVDLLLALDKRTLDLHTKNVSENGIVLYDEKVVLEEKKQILNYVPIPLTKIEERNHLKNVRNAVFLGAMVKSLGIDYSLLRKRIKDHFQGKETLVGKLLLAAKEGSDSVEENKETEFAKEIENKVSHFINGNDAITLGALKAGLTFHAQYPMTPVTGILHNLAKEAVRNKNLIVIQPEDEISAINMALGASYTGRRAMTATSGGGFSLMVESFGLAGMAEIPLVLIEGQRPGPATGLPTKTEQGDLKFVLSASQGDFPRVVIAPKTVGECYTETKRAFYLAEKYQLPVIVLVDKHLTESSQTLNLEEVEKEFTFNYDQRINMIESVNEGQLNSDGIYKRYEKDNINRTLPGTINGVYTCTGDEHDAVGQIIEEPKTRIEMMQRRMNKLKLAKKELPIPKLVGPEDAELTIVSWGSNYGAVVEAMEKLNLESKKVNFLCLEYLFPFHNKEVKELLVGSKKLVLLECNYSGQLGELIAEQTGIMIEDKILRYDGNPFTINKVYEELKKRLN